jgi:hypothetical protein
MKAIAVLGFSAAFIFPADFIFSANCAGARDLVRIEQASAGMPYDYVVHVQNTFSIGYNPQVRADRNHMALRALRGQCRAGQIVGEDKIITEIWGVTSSPPDYVVLVKCA